MANENPPVGSLMPNSNKYKATQAALSVRESQPPAAPIATMKIKKGPLEKVGVSEAVVKEKTFSEKLQDAFIAESVDNVKEYLVEEKIIPELKEFFLDMLFDGLSMLLGTKRRSTNYNRTDYSTMYSGGGTRYHYASSSNYYKRQPAPSDPVKSRSESDDPCEVIFKIGPGESPSDAKSTAIEVLANLRDAAEEYDHASVADLYELSGISPKSFTDNNYGWGPEHLAQAVIKRVREGYALELPHPMPID